MKLSQDEFKKLQKEWYKKLTEVGFKDIEHLRGNELVLKQSADHCYRHAKDEFAISMREEYFRQIGQKIEDPETSYRNEIDRYILLRHSEGTKIKIIIQELKAKGQSRHRCSIRFIIRKYEMEWGLKNYTPKQLHLKDKNDARTTS